MNIVFQLKLERVFDRIKYAKIVIGSIKAGPVDSSSQERFTTDTNRRLT